MKKILFGSVVVAVLSLAGLGRAYAQDVSTVKVPFPFVAGDKLLPAGDYRVAPAPADRSVLLIVSANGAASARVAVDPVGPVSANAKPTFVFRVFGKRYFLAEVSAPEVAAYEVPLTSKEVERVLARLDLADYRGEPVHHR